MMQGRRKECQRIKRSFVKVNIGMFSDRSLFFRHFLCFVSGLVFPVGSLLLKCDDFPLV